MKISELKATGIKGQNIEIEPRPVNVIVGPNYSGKTAVKNAIELALLGYIPGLGKKNQSVFELSNGDPINVLVSLDDESAVQRVWKRTGKSVRAESAGNFDVPPVMLDLGALFGMTKTERQEFLFGLAQTGKLTWESITAAVKSVAVDEPTEATEKALNNVMELVEFADGDEVPERLQSAITLIKDKTKVVNQEVKDHEGFNRTVTRQADLEAPVNNARAKVKTAREEVENAVAEVQKCQTVLREFVANINKLKSLQAHSTADVSELDQRLSAMIGEISDAEVNLDTLQAQLEEMQPEETNKKFSELSAKVATLVAEYNAIGRRGKDWESLMVPLGVKRNEFADYAICPTCGTPGDTWKVDLLAFYDAQIAEIQEKIDACDAELKAKKAEGIAARKAKDGVAAILKECHAKSQEVFIAQATLNKLNRERQTIEKQRQELIEQSSARLAAIENLRQELGETDQSDLEASVDIAREKEDVAREKLADADKELQQETANMTKALEIQKSLMRRQVAEAELKILKGSSKVLLEMQREAIENSFEPLLEVARQFTDGILKAPLAFHDGDLGYWDESTFVTHRTFSGTEEALAYAGLMIALASASGSPLKVIVLDEMGRFDPVTTRPRVMDRMIELASSGVIDHAFLIDNDRDYYLDTSWENNENVLIYKVDKNEVTA